MTKILPAIVPTLLITALIFNYLFFIINPNVSQTIWNIIDPVLLAYLGLFILISIVVMYIKSTYTTFTLLYLTAASIVTVLYAHNYILKVALGTTAANPWIWHFLVPAVVALLIIYLIKYAKGGQT